MSENANLMAQLQNLQDTADLKQLQIVKLKESIEQNSVYRGGGFVIKEKKASQRHSEESTRRASVDVSGQAPHKPSIIDDGMKPVLSKLVLPPVGQDGSLIKGLTMAKSFHSHDEDSLYVRGD